MRTSLLPLAIPVLALASLPAKPPSNAVKYHVAEVHGHFPGPKNDGILDY